MPNRTRKPTVEPWRYGEWLWRIEEGGESSPQIARKDGYDVRTVRKHVEFARQERELKEARSVVLRQALEHHYADLMALIADIESQVKRDAQIGTAVKEGRMWRALREHLPRSPIWRAMDRWDKLQQERHQLREDAKARMRSQVDANTEYHFASALGIPGLHQDGLSGLVADRLMMVARADAESIDPANVVSEPEEPDLIRLVCRGFQCATVQRDVEEGTRQFIWDLMKDITSWPEADGIRSVASELRKVAETLEEEMATVLLRRVVPGRCRYCPF